MNTKPLLVGDEEYIRWYDRKGKRLYDYREIEKLLRDYNYKVVKRERLWWGAEVSTVWLGLDHNHGPFFAGRKPLVFETMIFFGKSEWGMASLDYMERYSTEEEALEGHNQAKREFSTLKVAWYEWTTYLKRTIKMAYDRLSHKIHRRDD